MTRTTSAEDVPQHDPQEAPGQGELSTYMMEFLSPSSPAEGEERSVQEAAGWEHTPRSRALRACPFTG